MSKSTRYDHAMFWVALGGAVTVVGGIIAGIGANQESNSKADIWQSQFLRWGMGVAALGVIALWWALTLYLAHRHAEGHFCPDPEAHKPERPSVSPAVQSTQSAEEPVPAFANSGPALPPAEEERIFIDLTPEQLTGEFRDVTSQQGEERVKRYIGKWMRVAGPLGDVTRISDTQRRAYFADRSIFSYNVVRMRFYDKRNIDRLDVKNVGDPLTVVGRIQGVDIQNVDLDHCELEI